MSVKAFFQETTRNIIEFVQRVKALGTQTNFFD